MEDTLIIRKSDGSIDSILQLDDCLLAPSDIEELWTEYKEEHEEPEFNEFLFELYESHGVTYTEDFSEISLDI